MISPAARTFLTFRESCIPRLQVVDRGTKNLQLSVHSTFAVASPFIDGIQSRDAKRLMRTCESLSDSKDSSISRVSPSPYLKIKSHPGITPQGNTSPIPTILELGALQKGATKSRVRIAEHSEDTEESACVAQKLNDARCLRRARQAGLRREVASLRLFAQQGRAFFVSKQLVSLVSDGTKDPGAIQQFLAETVMPFCLDFGVDYDKALLEYIITQCRVKTGVERAVAESFSIAQCCSSDIMKAHAALAVLRTALLCTNSPDWLPEFSENAIVWASSDSALQSEVQEASRLLRINAMVLKYCGSGAKELFQVDNTSHASRLIDFVTRHVYEQSVLQDTLSLCDAYIHLNAKDACCSLFERAILQQDTALCIYFMSQLCSQNFPLAERVLAGVVSFVVEVLVETSSRLRSLTDSDRADLLRREGEAASRCIIAIIEVQLEHTRTLSCASACEIKCFLQDNSLETLRDDFSRIIKLQEEFSVWVSLSELSSPKLVGKSISTILQPLADAYMKERHDRCFDTEVARARRACSLLVGVSTKEANDIWVSVGAKVAIGLVREHTDESIISFLNSIGLFDAANLTDVSVLLSVALALCAEASDDIENSPKWVDGMHRIIKAASLLRDRCLLRASDYQLPVALSFGALVETACEILTRADEGKGESLDVLRQKMKSEVWEQTLPVVLRKTRFVATTKYPIRRPTLHRAWYIGDGLLLPPKDALLHSVRFCKNIVGRIDACSDILEFLRRSGAHFLSLRVLSSFAIQLFSNRGALSMQRTTFDWEGLGGGVSKATVSLAERSLGGSSQVGITSGVVDSQLSAAFLLSIPVKQAFRMYKSSLPTAMKTQDYHRVLTLARIGMVLCSSPGSVSLGGFFSVGWSGQKRFFDQCHKLAIQSQWWGLLREYGVKFDPQRFDEDKDSSAGRVSLSEEDASRFGASRYASSLLPAAIRGISRDYDSIYVLDTCFRYANAFGMSRSFVLKKHVEWCLSPLLEGDNPNEREVRWCLDKCRTVAKMSIRLLESHRERCSVLRNCLLNLEGSRSSQDYERYSLVLDLYHEALGQFVDHSPPLLKDCEVERFEEEIDMVDRRRDVMNILSSFFPKDHASERPGFTGLFAPLKQTFTSSEESAPVSCNILGKTDGDIRQLDPLKPLEKILSGSNSNTAAAALAPMCISLGLPPGYVHARSLIMKFQKASDGVMNCPSFENDVIPVFRRIRSPRDKAELAEWCAMQYQNKKDDEKLKCLDMALKFALEASSEIENLRRHGASDDEKAESAERQALETVKRISSVKSVLSDVLRVKAILRGACRMSNQEALSKIIERLVNELDQYAQERLVTPEVLIDFLLSRGSLAAAEAALDSVSPLSIVHLRKLCSVVHEASKSISDQHSHIRSSHRCRRLVRKWLFYGDSSSSGSSNDEGAPIRDAEESSATACTSSLIAIEQEEETVDFVMDLAGLHEQGDWETDAAPREPAKPRYTLEEEPSAIGETSAREVSEKNCQRASLRIAFVLAFADADSSSADESASGGGVTDNLENAVSRSNRLVLRGKRPGLLAKLESKRDSHREDHALGHSRELLRIVFAQASFSANLFGTASSFEGGTISEESVSNGSSTSHGAQDTVTFAMRHRALRAASILCPQEALERVIQAEGFLDDAASGGTGNDDRDCSLSGCAFGAFVAKEIEEMGLSLPHSDLGQISSMHYPSYARALHRDHHHRLGTGSGRLSLLLLEMSLRTASVDASFVNSVLDEIAQMHLPRTLLIASEHVARYCEENRSVPQPSVLGPVFAGALASLTSAVTSEARRVVAAGEAGGDGALREDDSSSAGKVRAALQSIDRLGKVTETFGAYGDEGRDHVERLAHELNALLSQSSSLSAPSDDERFSDAVLRSTLARLLRQLRRKDRRRGLLQPGASEGAGSEGQRDRQGVSDALARLEASLA